MAVFDLHNPGVFAAGILGNIVSILVYFAPLPTFIRIYKRKSTLEFQSLPYIVALFSAMLWIYYAFLKKNAILLISVNSVGIVTETLYIAIFLFYASKGIRKEALKVLLVNVLLFVVIFLCTTFWFEEHHSVIIVGWICVAFSISVFAAPLSIMFQVVRTGNVEFMPFLLSFFLTLSAIIWFAYGLLQRDPCVALPNILGFILGVLQMLLYGMYKNKNEKNVEVKAIEEEKKEVAEVPINIIDMVKTGGAIDQVYKLDSQTSTSFSCCSNSISSNEDEQKDVEDTARIEVIAPCSDRD